MKKTLLATLALTLGLTGAAFAQSANDFVTLKIDAADVQNGVQDGNFSVAVWITLDSAINGGTLGFSWSDFSNWRLDSVVNGPAISSWEIAPPPDTAAANLIGKVLLGGAAIFASTAAGPDQLFATMYFSLKSGNTWTTGSDMLIDSTFVEPGGEFVLIRTPSGTNFLPTFTGAHLVTFSDALGDDGAALPEVFSVSQNYPNPFNPSTNIMYSVAKRSHVSLEVFNLLGQKVKTLVDVEMDAGSYPVTWDGDNDEGSAVASGVYFYKMVAGDFVQTRKMMLMK